MGETGSYENRRVFIRTGMAIPVHCYAVAAEKTAKGRYLVSPEARAGYLVDLSGGGLQAVVDADLLDSGYIGVELPLPTFTDGPQLLICRIIQAGEWSRTRAIVRARFEPLPQRIQDAVIHYVSLRECS